MVGDFNSFLIGGRSKEKVSPHHIKLDSPANHHRARFSDGNSVAHPYKEEHSSAVNQSRLGHGDGVPKNQNVQSDHAGRGLSASRKRRSIPLGDSMLEQLHLLEKTKLDPPSGLGWMINEDGWMILTKRVQGDNVDTRIHVCPHHTGDFVVVLGDQEIINIPSLRQAVSLAESIAFVFEDNLPAPLYYKHANSHGE